MKIIIIHKIKNRLLQLARMMFVLAIIFILIVQLVETIKAVNWKSQADQHRSLWVNQAIVEQSEGNGEQHILDRLLNRLRDYHRGEK